MVTQWRALAALLPPRRRHRVCLPPPRTTMASTEEAAAAAAAATAEDAVRVCLFLAWPCQGRACGHFSFARAVAHAPRALGPPLTAPRAFRLPAPASPQDLEAIFDASKKKKKRKPAAAAAGDDASAAAGAGRQVAVRAGTHLRMRFTISLPPLLSPRPSDKPQRRECRRGRGRGCAGCGHRGRAERRRL